MRHILALVLASSMLAAGCVSSAADVDAVPAAPQALAPLDMPWSLSSCAAAVAFIDVAADKVRPHVPEGFEPVQLPHGLVGAAPRPTDDAAFGIEMFVCARGAGLDGDVAPLAYGSYFAVVQPPEELRHDVDAHFVKWDVLVPDAPRRELLLAHGVPARDGSTEFATFDQTGPVSTIEGTLVLGNATHAFSARTAAPGAPSMTFVEFTSVPGGLVAWEAAAALSASGVGRGVVEVAEGNLAAEVLGAGAHEALLMVFQGDFAGGRVRTLPDA